MHQHNQEQRRERCVKEMSINIPARAEWTAPPTHPHCHMHSQQEGNQNNRPGHAQRRDRCILEMSSRVQHSSARGWTAAVSQCRVLWTPHSSSASPALVATRCPPATTAQLHSLITRAPTTACCCCEACGDTSDATTIAQLAQGSGRALSPFRSHTRLTYTQGVTLQQMKSLTPAQCPRRPPACA